MRDISQMNVVTGVGAESESGSFGSAGTYRAKIVKGVESNLLFTAVAFFPVILTFNAFGNFAHFTLLL